MIDVVVGNLYQIPGHIKKNKSYNLRHIIFVTSFETIWVFFREIRSEQKLFDRRPFKFLRTDHI